MTKSHVFHLIERITNHLDNGVSSTCSSPKAPALLHTYCFYPSPPFAFSYTPPLKRQYIQNLSNNATGKYTALSYLRLLQIKSTKTGTSVFQKPNTTQRKCKGLFCSVCHSTILINLRQSKKNKINRVSEKGLDHLS